MQREELKKYIAETYHTGADHPWVRYPSYEVFRHSGNNKWFALVMDIPKIKLGLPDDGILDAVNVKCDPALIGGLLSETGIFPAYHMSKNSWITVALDGSVPEEKIKILLDMSFNLTNTKGKKS